MMISKTLCVVCLVAIVFTATVSSSSRIHHHHQQHRLDQLLDFFVSRNVQEFFTWSQEGSRPSPKCRDEITAYLKGLRNGESWADKMFDATGRYSSNFLFGNDYFLGSQSLCIELARNFTLENQKDKNGHTPILRWRVNPPPFEVVFHVVKLSVTLPLQRFHENGRMISWGLCLPGGCSPQETEQLVSTMAERVGDGGVAPTTPTVEVVSSRRVPGNYSFWTDKTFHIMATTSAIILVLTAVGTVLDLIQREKRRRLSEWRKNAEEKSVAGMEKTVVMVGSGSEGEKGALPYGGNTLSKFKLLEIVLCFSIARNAKKILGETRNERTSEVQNKGVELIGCQNNLSCLHGLRFLSLLWIILGHTCHVSFIYSDNKSYRAVVERDFWFQTVGNGSFAVDTFFFISGLLLSFLYFRSGGVRELTAATTPPSETLKRRCKQFGMLVAYRIVRLTPPYLFVLGLVELTMKRFRSDSVFEPPTDDDVNCPNYWWRNALYVNTLFPVKEMCMIWSWYLSDDTQFYVIGLVLLMITSSHFKVAAFSAILMLFCTWFTSGLIALEYDYMPRISEPLALFDQLYDKPWTRIGPHIIGLISGWIVHKSNCKMNISKCTLMIGWTSCITICLMLVYGLHGTYLDPMPSAIYAALSHTAWAASLLWLVTACAAGRGGWINKFLSWTALAPLSRLTYCTYLVHPIIIRATVAHLDSPLHISRDSFAFLFAGHVIASYFLAFVISITLESPIISLLKMVLSVRRHN